MGIQLHTNIYKGKVSDACRKQLIAELSRLENKRISITIEEYKPTRSTQQNKYYWGVVIPVALKYYTDNVGDLIRDLMAAMKFRLTNDFVHELFKILFNKGKSTTSLKTDSMTTYWDKIREHFLHDYRMDIPEPNTEVIEELNGERK